MLSLAVHAFLMLVPSQASAQPVTFKATGAVSEVYGYSEDVRSAFLARFPLGTPFELTYTFDVATSPSSLGQYDAITALTIRIGDYTAEAVVLPIRIFLQNDVGILKAPPGVLPCFPEGGALIGDTYWIVPGVGALAAPAPLTDFDVRSEASLQLQRACVSGANLAGMFSTDQLSASPPELGIQDPDSSTSGLWLSWHDAAGWAHVYAPVLSLVRIESNTSNGQDVLVNPPVALPDGSTTEVSLTFDNVESSGDTTVTTSSAGPPPPSGFKLTSPPVYYEITTTASFTGNIRVCLSWVEGHVSNERSVRIFHYESGHWVDITDPTSRDGNTNTVCGVAAGLSPFTLFDEKLTFNGFFSPVDNTPVINSAKAGAAVPVKFSLGGNQGLDIFAAGYPKTALIQCPTGATIDVVEETTASSTSGLVFDPATGRYAFVWKTEKAWTGSCRELQLMFRDGETYRARFTFTK